MPLYRPLLPRSLRAGGRGLVWRKLPNVFLECLFLCNSLLKGLRKGRRSVNGYKCTEDHTSPISF